MKKIYTVLPVEKATEIISTYSTIAYSDYEKAKEECDKFNKNAKEKGYDNIYYTVKEISLF